jgi:hypothetical protein
MKRKYISRNRYCTTAPFIDRQMPDGRGGRAHKKTQHFRRAELIRMIEKDSSRRVKAACLDCPHKLRILKKEKETARRVADIIASAKKRARSEVRLLPTHSLSL